MTCKDNFHNSSQGWRGAPFAYSAVYLQIPAPFSEGQDWVCRKIVSPDQILNRGHICAPWHLASYPSPLTSSLTTKRLWAVYIAALASPLSPSKQRTGIFNFSFHLHCRHWSTVVSRQQIGDKNSLLQMSGRWFSGWEWYGGGLSQEEKHCLTGQKSIFKQENEEGMLLSF